MKNRLVTLFFYFLFCTNIFAQTNIAPENIIGKRVVFYDVPALLENQGSFLFKKNRRGDLKSVRYSDLNTLKCFYFKKTFEVKSIFTDNKGKQYIEAQSEETMFYFLLNKKYTYLEHVLVLDSIEDELEANKRRYHYKLISDREKNQAKNLNCSDKNWLKISPLYANVSWEGYVLPTKFDDGITWIVSYLGQEGRFKGDMLKSFLSWEELDRNGAIMENICYDIYMPLAIGDPLSADVDVNKIYNVVQQPPTFPGGDAALLKYVATHIKYPESAIKDSIQGVVSLRFVVEADGSVGEVQIAKRLQEDCDKEAVRVVKSLPRFIPGKQQGAAVRVWFSLPVGFQMKETKVQ